MKKSLLLIATASILMGGCTKKSSQSSTSYSKQIAGSRSYKHTHYNVHELVQTVIDTTTLSITYVSDDDLLVGNISLAFVQTQSTNTKLFYQSISLLSTDTVRHATLFYNTDTKQTIYQLYNDVTENGKTNHIQDSYESL